MNHDDPIKRNAEKDFEKIENTPMDPPDAYTDSTVQGVQFEELALPIQKFMNEHKVCLQKMDELEKALIQFRKNHWLLDKEVNLVFKNFFEFFDNNIIQHNIREEKFLFPLIQEKLILEGEHSPTANPKTAVDLLEDDHVKVIQMGTLVFNFLGLAPRLPDQESRNIVNTFAFDQGMELCESIRLHIHREDETVFPLAHKLISKTEFDLIESEMNK